MNFLLYSFVADQFPDIALDKSLFIACQHVMKPTCDMLEEFFKKGLQPKNTFLIGKCYSTNEEAYTTLQNRGVQISSYSKEFDSHTSFDEQFLGYVKKFFEHIQSSVNFNDFDNIIILDDGGNLLLHAHNFLEETKKVVGIEQTSSGFEKLKDVSLRFPVVNIARSKAKLEVESPFIAKLIVDRLRSTLGVLNIKDPRILVIGQGYIGVNVLQNLKNEFNVNGCDNISNKCDFEGNYRDHIGEFDVIIGTTGQTVIGENDFAKLKQGVILISASSSDREFSAVHLRKLVEKAKDCHQNFDINGIILINGGFPVNFTGEPYSLPPNQAQFTRSLLLAGVFQAVSEKGSGFVDLNPDIQEKIIREFDHL